MRKILAVSFGLAVCFPGAALAQAPTLAHVQQYLRAYHTVRRLDGPAAAGCNLIGRRGSCHVRASDAQVTKSLGVLYRTLNPPSLPTRIYTTRPMTSATLSYAPRPSTTATAGTGGWAIPSSIVQCESGGQNLPPNGASAAGYYQIIQSTWQANGGGQYSATANGATQAEQSQIAARIWNGGRGRSQWVC